ncbi:MAG: acetyl esterase/lipase [Patiriisocius sp.]
MFFFNVTLVFLLNTNNYLLKLINLLIIYLLAVSCSPDSLENSTNTNQKTANLVLGFEQYLNLESETIFDVPYDSHSEQVMDIYLPEDRSFSYTKVLVLVHGGSWQYGDKTSFTNLAEELKERHPNHAIVNLNYRLADTSHAAFPNQFIDIKNALEYLEREADNLKIKPEFGLIGGSSGGHLALYYDYKFDTNDAVKFVCSMSGPTDFADSFYQQNPNFNQLIELLIDKDAYGVNSNGSREDFIPGSDLSISYYLDHLSPLYHVNSQSSPTLLFHGDQDEIVPIANAYMLNKTLTYASVKNKLNVYTGDHSGWILPFYRTLLHSEISDFILKFL